MPSGSTPLRRAAPRLCYGSSMAGPRESRRATLRSTASARADAQGAAEVAYRWIRRAILTGALRSGAKLAEKTLAAQIGVSRTPVREALMRLESQGLVVLEHYRRGYVAHFTVEDAQEILRLRAVLEGHAAHRAATRITAEQIAELEALATEMEQKFAALGYEGYLDDFEPLNAAFHMVIARAAASPRLVRILETSLELPAVRLSEYSEANEPRTVRNHRQHREIIAALKARNAGWAQHEMTAHLTSLLLPDEP
jgi:DNA-binding GntR family transcriptional regulator